jgi:Ca2+-binding EF-hand superfamily protein
VTEVLDLFDAERTGFILTSDVPSILHSLGVFINDAEFAAAELPQLGSAGEPAPRCARERVEARALALLAARAHAPPSALELLAAFRVFDKAGTGSVGVDKLRRALTNPAAPGALSVEDFDRMLEHLPAAATDGEGQPPRAYGGYARALL